MHKIPKTKLILGLLDVLLAVGSKIWKERINPIKPDLLRSTKMFNCLRLGKCTHCIRT